MAKAISSSKAHSRKQTITQAAASDADMERMVPYRQKKKENSEKLVFAVFDNCYCDDAGIQF